MAHRGGEKKQRISAPPDLPTRKTLSHAPSFLLEIGTTNEILIAIALSFRPIVIAFNLL